MTGKPTCIKKELLEQLCPLSRTVKRAIRLDIRKGDKK
jgi:hypothetical protein